MRIFLFALILCTYLSCDTQNAVDCFQTTGDIINRDIEVPDFNRILVLENIELILRQGNTTSVEIESGQNLIDEVTVQVIGDQLIVRDTNDCNFVRDFNQTKIYVQAPNITEIRSETQFEIRSDGVLNFPNLTLFAEDFIEDNGGKITGTYRLELNATNLEVSANKIVSFFISGSVQQLTIGIFAGLTRFEGQNLNAQNVTIFHRGQNNIIVNPQQSIRGELRSTGDIIVVNRPVEVNVSQFYTGILRFED